MNGQDPVEDIRRKLERLLGYQPGQFDPRNPFLRDMEKINKALGEGFEVIQVVMNPQQMLDRIEALHPDQAALKIRGNLDEILRLPLSWMTTPPEEMNGFTRRA